MDLFRKQHKEIFHLKPDVNRTHCDCGNNTYYVVDSNNVNVGKACIRYLSWYSAEIIHLFVKESHRRKGVATFLNKEFFKIIGRDRTTIFVTVRKDNKPSLKLMKSLGMKEIQTFVSRLSEKEVVLFFKKLERDYENKVEETQENS